MKPSYSIALQEGLVFALVALIAVRMIGLPVARRLAHPLAFFLLKRGRVKWAMRVRGFALGSDSWGSS